MTRRLLSVAVLPVLLFLAAFVGTFFVFGAIDALAQPVEEGSAKYAPPSDEMPPQPSDPAVDAEKARVGKEAAGDDIKREGPGKDKESMDVEHEDPSRHFNFFGLDYRGKDELGGKFGDGVMIDPETGARVPGEEEPKSAPFMFMLLNFVILMGLLVWKGRPAARQLAEERHDAIKSALDEAAKLRKQAADKLAEYEARLKDADTEIKNMVEGMRTDAEADKKRILDNAEKQSAQMKKDAETRIAAEIELARTNLTREVTAAATAATEKLLREKMMPGDQQKLVSSFITDVQSVATKEAR